MATSISQQINISKVYLDNENPRHDPIDNEPEIIAHLLAHHNVRQLSRSICDLGTSPLDRFAVCPHPDREGVFISLEGNRRLCALKLLHDPDKAPTEQHRKYFRDLKKKSTNAPRTIDCAVFKDRDEADPWLRIRHEGEQEGIGTREWRAREKERYNRRREGGGDNPNAQAALLLEYGLNSGLISPAQHDAIGITTLTRFLSNPLVRDALGLDNPRDLTSRAPDSEVHRAFKRFLTDAYTKTNVTSRTSVEHREAYARRLRTEDEAVKTRSASARNLSAAKGKTSAAKANRTARHNANPDKRAHVIPVEFVFRIRDKLLKRIYDELRSIDSETHSFAAAYLLRAFVERAVFAYCDKKSVPRTSELHKTIRNVADALVKNGASEDRVKPFRRMATDKHDSISPHTLGAAVHGSLIPTRAELNRQWDAMEDCLKLLVSELT
jgi:hypothetical protein